jgi:hypothetical protein
MYVSNSDVRERVSFLECVLDELGDALRNEAVYRALGADAIRLYTVAENMYLPNVRNGVISAPREYIDTDLIPFVACNPSESLMLDPNVVPMSTSQAQKVALVLQRWREDTTHARPLYDSTEAVNDELVKSFSPEDEAQYTFEGTGGVAACEAIPGREVELGCDKSAKIDLILGKPVVAVSMSDQHVPYERAVIAAHEFKHVADYIDTPVIYGTELHISLATLKNELRAYSIGAKIGRSLGIPQRLIINDNDRISAIQLSYAVEDYRQKHAWTGTFDSFDSYHTRHLLGMVGISTIAFDTNREETQAILTEIFHSPGHSE